MLPSVDERKKILMKFTNNPAVIRELLEYNQNRFIDGETTIPQLPLNDEPFIYSWEKYLEESKDIGVFPALKKRIVQLNFPIEKNISQTFEYRDATRKGIWSDNLIMSKGLSLEDPESIELRLHKTLAGKIPLIIIKNRNDFENIMRAILYKSEPAELPGSMGAMMIAGYNNWDRIHRLKEEYKKNKGDDYTEDGWKQEFSFIIHQKELYQDKFILLSSNYYSSIQPETIGLTPEEFHKKSIDIRVGHETTHYFTKRIFNNMQNNAIDELIADYAGIVTAFGIYHSQYFLEFIGLGNPDHFRSGGRLENYKGTPQLSDEAFKILQKMVYQAAKNLEKMDQQLQNFNSLEEKLSKITVELCKMTLETISDSSFLKKINIFQ